jgi:hypothetical protein
MHPLATRIDSLQHRLLLRRRLVAVCRIAAAVLAAALLLGAVDYAFRYADRGLRIMATAALVATAVWAAYRWWYVPSRRQLIPLTVAQRIETRFPQLGDSLASAIDFLRQSEDDPRAGSAQLRRHVITAAETAVAGLELDDVIDRRPLRRAASWLAAAILVVAIFAAIDPGAVGTAIARLAVPFGGTQWPRVNHLEFRNAPSHVAAGQPFEVELIDSGGQLPDEVRIEYRTLQGDRAERESEAMTRIGDVMIARRDSVDSSFSFRAAGGDDNTMPWHDVEVIEPPQLDSLEVTVHPAEYTGLAAAPAERHLEVLEGSGIEARGTSNEPLGAARVLVDNDQAVMATIESNAAGNARRAFHIPPDNWIATKSSTYRVELTDADGLAGIAGQWNLRVNPDTPPSISWQLPSGDLHVTPNAVVPVALTVRDNLAIKSVELFIELLAASKGGESDRPTREQINLLHGPERVAIEISSTGSFAGDSRVVEHSLDLASMNLSLGAKLTLQAEATDYKPSVGRTVAPRRIFLITPDELEARLADRQSQIVRQIERALATERTTREDTRRLEIQQRDAGSLSIGDRNAIQSMELNQRRVGHMLNDSTDGIPMLIDALLAELEVNRLSASDTRATMRQLTGALDRLASEPLPTAERELTSARKSAESADAPNSAAILSRSLNAAGAAQDQVIAELEQLLSELSGWVDFRRFARQLAELRQDQIAHLQTSRAEIGVETLPLAVGELNRAQRANLNKASAGQHELARRYEKIEQGIDDLARELAEKDAATSARLADAVDLARRLTISTDMHETSRDFSENRVGVALTREALIADDLQRVLDLLRNQSTARGQQLIDHLRRAQERLNQLRSDATNLRRQIQRAEQQGANTNARALAALNERESELRRQIEQLSRELDRLQAEAAKRSTESAANQLNKPPPGGEQNASDQKPSSSNQVRRAEQNLKQAADELAKRIREAEFDLALEFVRRFQTELRDMITRQKQVITDTAAIDKSRDPSSPMPDDQSRKIAELADAERELAGLAIEHGEVLHGLTAVRISLDEAARRLNAAADLLDRNESGTPAQQAESHALARLEGMLEAFAQTAAEAGQKPPGGGAAGQNGQQRRPTFELLEVKMLRMLQVDLNERTNAFRQQLAAAGGQPDEPRAQAALAREAQQLAAEQRRLAGLVQEMLTRNNKPQDE